MLNPLSTIRPDERRAVQGALITLSGIMASHALLETARDALFLGSIPPTRLPWVYLCIAVVAVVLTRLQSRLPLGEGNRRVLGSLLVGSTAITLGLWFLLGTGQEWVLPVVYIWAGVFATLVVVRFWMVVDDVFTVTQAKRVFAVIGAGSVIGAISGSALARLLALWVEPRHFLLAAVVLIGTTSLLPLTMLHPEDQAAGKDPRHEPPRLRWRATWRTILARPYVSRLLALVLVSTVALTLVDYLFKSIIAETVPAHRLATFFSTTYLSLNLISLLLQLTVVSAILKSLSLDRALGLTPALLLGGAVLVMTFYTLWPLLILWPAVALKGIDGSLRHSLHRTLLETLYVPLSRELREQVKTFIDVLGQRGGQALASVLILVVILLPGWQMVLASILFLLCCVWIRIGIDIRRDYLDLFRDTLKQTGLASRLEYPELDMASLESLIAALNSSDDLEVLAALDMLEEQNRGHLIPALILYHPSPQIVTRALEILRDQQRDDILPVLDRLSEHESAEVRAAALLARSRIAPDVNRQLKEFLDDPAPMVRATALVTLVTAQWIEGADAEKALRAIAASAEPDELSALVRSIQQQPDPIHVSLLLELSERERENRTLMREIALAMKAVRDERFLEALIAMLPYREARSAARDALVELGQAAIDRLAEHLGDEAYPQNIRRHIPRTLSRFEPILVADILQSHLLTVRDGLVRYKILRALGGLRRRDPDLPLDQDLLYRGIEATLAGALRLIDWTLNLEREARDRPELKTPTHDLLVHALRHKRRRARERLFRLLNLWHPQENWQRIYRGLASESNQARASSLELIDALLDEPLRSALHAYVDDLPDKVRVRSGRAFYQRRKWKYEEMLTAFLDEGSLGLRCITVHHIGELGLTEFRDRLVTMLDHPSPVQREIVEKALARLDTPATAEGDPA